MDPNPNNAVTDPAYERARRHVVAIKGFYSHFAIYCIVITALFFINYATRSHWWFFWPAIGWGIGVALHALAVFGFDSFLGADWEERKIRELMEKERAKSQ